MAAESKPTETSAPAAEPTSAPKDAAAPAQAPFDKLAAQLPSILAAAEHSEMWGVELSGLGDELTVPARIVLQKFLNANEGDPDKAAEQLGAALKFRKEKKPLELVNRVFSKAKFENLGLVTWYDSPGSKVPEVFTWNLYGNVKDRMDEVFVPLEE